MDDDAPQLSEITTKLLLHYNKQFDDLQKENQKICEYDKHDSDTINIRSNSLGKKYTQSLLNASYNPKDSFTSILQDKIKENAEKQKIEKKMKLLFECNYSENKKTIVNIKEEIKGKNTINFIEDQLFLFKVIKYRRLEVIKQLLYFKKNIEIYKYLCILILNYEQKTLNKTNPEYIYKLAIFNKHKQHVLQILNNFFIDNSENLLRSTLYKYKFLTDRFFKIIPTVNSKEEDKWLAKLISKSKPLIK
jgi:hypothetical protein